MIEEQDINSPSTRRLIAIIVSSFLVTFVISRLIVYLVVDHLIPNMFLVVRGVHIHHFTYGVVILVLVGLYMILLRPKPETKKFFFATLFYGIGLGLTFDEFGMWIRLEDDYWVRQSYDAVVIITLLLFNIAYYKPLMSLLNMFGRTITWPVKKIRKHL